MMLRGERLAAKFVCPSSTYRLCAPKWSHRNATAPNTAAAVKAVEMVGRARIEERDRSGSLCTMPEILPALVVSVFNDSSPLSSIGEVQVESATLLGLEPTLDGGTPVGAVVVRDEVNVQPGRHFVFQFHAGT